MLLQQPEKPSRIVVVVDQAHSFSPSLEKGCFTGWQWDSLRGKIIRSGLYPDSIDFIPLAAAPTYSFTGTLIVGMGEETLRFFTDKRGIDKWQLSPLYSRNGQKFIPTFDMNRVQKQYELGLYQEMAFGRAAEESLSARYNRAEEKFHLNPSLEETNSILEEIKDKE